MITRLTGRIAARDLAEIVIDCNGVGYGVTVPLSTFDRLPSEGEDVSLLTHLVVREDAWQLFGFATEEERLMFRLLTTVSGIGPKLALNVLSALSVDAFSQMVRNADVKGLARVNGLGKRTAERLVVELRERIGQVPLAAGAGQQQAGTPSAAGTQHTQDAIAALENLGFKRDKAQRVVDRLAGELPAEEQTTENLIRKALSALNT